MSTDTPLAWDDSRCAELDLLHKLIREVGSINSGSHCLDRIARCIDLAAALDKTDFRTGRPRFIRFLGELAIAERSAAKAAA